MFRACAIVVRTSYLLAVLVTLVKVSQATYQFVRALDYPRMFGSGPSTDVFVILVLLGFWVLALRALGRLLLRHELVPDDHLRERPVVASIVALTCILGTWMTLLPDWFLLTTLPESRDVNLAAPWALGLLCYAVALLVGELVLVGGRQSRLA